MLPERRYSEWRPGVKPKKRWELISIGNLLLFCGLLPFAFSMYLIACGVFLLGLALMSAGLVLYSRDFEDAQPSRDMPSAIPQYSATVRLKRETFCGSTAGLVSFVDGWLVFSARDLDFSVRSEDVILGVDDGKTAFHFDGPGGTFQVVFRPVKSGQWRAFQQAWIEWVRWKKGSDGVPIFPPVRPYPGYRPAQIGFWTGIAFTIAGIVGMLWSFASAVLIVQGLIMIAGDLFEMRRFRRLVAGLPVPGKEGGDFGEGPALPEGREARRK